MLSELSSLLWYIRLVHCRPGFDPRPTSSTTVHSGLFSKTSAKAQAMEQLDFKKCKQLFEYQHILLLRGICWLRF
jgi:hypothetical protein